MSEPIRLAVIGCGGIAQAYLQALGKVPELSLSALVDTDDKRLAAARGTRDIPCFKDVAELLKAREKGLAFTAALVLTPPNTHETIAIALLQARVHVLCEKPLTTTIPAAERMVQVATKTRQLLMMGSKFRYTPDVGAARQLLDQGLIGDVLLFENVFCSRVDMKQRWNSSREVSGGGVLIDNGCHAVDIARFLLGPIARVQVQYGKQMQALEVEDTARVMFESQSGAMGSIDLSWSLHKEVPSYVRLYGSKGTLEIGWKVSRYKLQGQSDWTPFGNGYEKIGAFAAQLSNFAGTILGREEPVITESDALASVRVIDSAYRSANTSKWHEAG